VLETDRRAERWFRVGLVIAAVIGLAVRLAYVWFERRGLPVNGDAYYYHQGANLLADGKGYVEPFLYDAGRTVQAADHPPVYMTYLAVWSKLGLDSPSWHLIASALLGSVTVGLTGIVGRMIGGRRVGVVAALLAALNPNLWAYDGFIVSETAAQLAVVLVLLATYAWWQQPTRRRAAVLGAVIAFGALSRAELSMLAILLLVPLVAFHPALAERKERFRQLGISLLALGVLVAPWSLYNLSRFDKPVLLSGGFEITLDSASCDVTYYGEFTGYWSTDCVRDALAQSGLPPDTDRAVLGQIYRKDATSYIGDNLSRVPVVIAARLGRITGLWNVSQQMQLDNFPEGREVWVAHWAWYWYYALAILSIGGGAVLRRRGTPVFPLVVFPVIVLLSVTITFATTRYRAIAEPVLVLMAAAAIDRLLTRARPRPSGTREDARVA